MKVAIIGFGNMGATFAKGFINSRYIDSENIIVYTRSKQAIEDSKGSVSFSFRYRLDSTIQGCDIIIISVKPQDFTPLALQLKPFVQPEHIIISVMAGISIEQLQVQLGVNKVVRAMPNLPTQIGKGMTVFAATEHVDRKELFIIQNLINTTGQSVYVAEEDKIDGATAVSGSGPAYVFYFMQAMISSAVSFGFDQAQAELLVKQTIAGTLGLYESSSLSTSAWIAKVSCKGGTTEKAMEFFAQCELDQLIQEGMEQAKKQAVYLGKALEE